MNTDDPKDDIELPVNSESPTESFDEMLGWLDPDREVAWSIYEDLRHGLTKIFMWGHCANPAEMTDETFDRVASQIHELKARYEGDPRRFFYGVAKNLIREYQKKIMSHVSLEGLDFPADPPAEEEEPPDMLGECLEVCLRELTPENRELILTYYAKEKQAKIDFRKEMARQRGITIETLRVRARRIRAALEECIEHKLEQRPKRA